MTNGELVSRVSNQLRMISKDTYINSRFILHTAIPIATKLITQKIQRRSIDRDMSLYKEVQCIEFEKVNSFTCGFVEFKNCNTLYKSKNKITDLGLVFTRYGSSLKELYSIDGISTVFTENTLYQYRLNSQRQGNKDNAYFYILDDYIYVTKQAEVLSGLFLALNQYELDQFCGCSDDCESVWDKEFVAPDSMLPDIIEYTVQSIAITKNLQPDENPDLNENSK